MIKIKPKKGDAREFHVFAAGADRSFSKFFLGKFPGGIPDLKQSIDGGPWRMRRGQPPNTQEPTPTPKPLETPEDWILESKPGVPILKGKPEDAGGGSSYFLLVKARRGDDFIAMPIEETYNFKPVRRAGAINLEDAEAEMKYRREHFSKINTKLAAVGDGERDGGDGTAAAAAAAAGGGGKATEDSSGQANDEDGDSDEEFKDIKARAAVTAALKQRAANHRVRRQQQQQAPNLALDDAVAEKHEATWNEVFQEPPKDAEDWEHEDEAADDDLDMSGGGGGGDEDGSDNDDDLGLGKGGGEKGGGMGGGGGGGKGWGRLGSPSDSDDDDGVATAARVHRRLKKMMKESGNGGGDGDGDGMSSEEDDLYTDGDSDDDDDDSDMIEDVDALDRMAEDMMSGGGGGGEMKSEAKEEEGGGGGRKRKSPPPPAASAVFSDQQQDGQAKKLKVDIQQQQAEVTVGPVTADEIIILLRGRGKMSLSDIAAYFKARLKTTEDKKDFTALVKKVAKLDPQPDPDGKKYLILK